MVLKINIWRAGIVALSEDILKPSTLLVQKDLSMVQFLQILKEKYNLANPIVMKRNPMLNQKQLEVLSTEKSLSQLRVNEGVNLFVEDFSDVSQWEQEFELDQNRLQVKFNRPSTKVLDIQYKDFLIVDRRQSVLDLKIQIANTLELSLAELVFRRGGTHGAELVEDELSLKQAQFYNLICVFVQTGVPSQVG